MDNVWKLEKVSTVREVFAVANNQDKLTEHDGSGDQQRRYGAQQPPRHNNKLLPAPWGPTKATAIGAWTRQTAGVECLGSIVAISSW